MSRRAQIVALGVLLAVLAVILYRTWRATPETVSVSAAAERFQPLPVENPSLRIDMLERIRNLEYSGTRRNIFTASVPPLPQPKVDPGTIAPAPPQGPPPLEVPVKFFGYVASAPGGARRGFFINGEDVFIVAEGETLLNQFRLLRVGNTTAEVEEIGSGRRATLVLEEMAPPS